MKVCPVCGAECFDDMDRCYECLHSFSEDANIEKTPIEQMEEAAKNSKVLNDANMINVDDFSQVPEKKCSERGCNFSYTFGGDGNLECDDSRACVSSNAQKISSESFTEHPVCELLETNDVSSVKDGEKTDMQTWLLKLGVPADCKGVTVRLERAFS